MIYYVSNQTELIESDIYKLINVEESLQLIKDCKVLQYDCETDSLDCHIGNLLCVQFGSKKGDFQIVVDCTTVNISLYKEVLENSILVGHNLKFDLQWLYNYYIIPRKIYDTMIVEQLLYLGYPHITLSPEEYQKYNYDFPYLIDNKNNYALSYSLKALTSKYLNINMDKTIRGNIIYEGLSDAVIQYAANDVKYLEDIMELQMQECIKKGCTVGAKLECSFVPAIAYLEWCGIKLNEKKWLDKMSKDKENLEQSLQKLNDYALHHPKLQKWVKKNLQGDLFEGFDNTFKWTVDWQKKEVIKVVKALGFNVSTISKQTNKESESIMEKVLSPQTGIDDKFLKLYFEYQGYYKVCSSFGQGHLNAINPNTGRIHTSYKAIGTISGRMSCGSDKENTALTTLKKLPKGSCKYPNMQQLPHDSKTRSCFICEENNVFVSVDWAAMEARIGAEVYNEKTLLDEFLYGSGDSHAAYAKVVFAEELKDIEVKDIKKLRPDLRDSVKSIEFSVQFGSDGTAAASQLKIPVQEARELVNNLLKGMTGLASFKQKAGKDLMNRGYVLIMPQTGHKAYWWDYNKWKERQESFNQGFWEDYRNYHKGTGDNVAVQVKKHFQAVSKWRDRMSLNLPTQGGGAVCLKDACTALFNWIVDNGYFNIIKLVNFTHDEINSECPKELQDSYPKLVEQIMQDTCAKYFKKLPIPAESAVGDHWIH